MPDRPDTDTPDASIRLSDYVEDAIELRSHLSSWEKDQEFIADGGQIIYSVDVDVIKLYLDPSTVAVRRSDGRPGYTQVFRYDDAVTAEALADGVCDAIFFDRLNRAQAVVLLQPMEEELGDVFQAILLVAEELEHRELLTLSLQPEIDKALRSPLTSGEEKYAILRDQVPSIAAYLYEDKGPHAELKRLDTLADQSRLVSLENFSSQEAVSEMRGLVLPGNKMIDWLRRSKIREVVLPELTLGKRPEIAVRDSSAIEVIALINEQLAPLRIRVIHITGDHRLRSVTAGIPAQPWLSWDEAGEHTPSFAESFIRHPSCFLAAPDVIFPHQSTAGWSPQLGITGVIDYFLAQTDSRAGLSRSIIENRCRHALERYPDALSDFEDKWRDLVKPLFLKRLQVSTERRLFADAGGIFNDFAAYIERDFRTSLMRCLESALSTGFLIDEPSQGAFRPARDVPVIWFDCESADDALASIQAWLLTQDSEQTELSFDYEEALRELRTIQHSEYFFFLTFAVLFAANGRWKMTSMLTHRAIDVASTVASSGAAGAEWIPPAVHGKTGKPRRAVMTPVSGREAYYACSIATRVTARSVSDFDKAARLLDKAYEALESDRQRLEADGEADYLKILTTVRFDVEKLAHQVALFLFTRFKPTNTAVELLTRDDFLRRTQELLRCVSEEPSGLQEGLRRRLLVNLFSRYLHDEQWRSESSSGGSLVDELRTLLAQLGEVVAHDEAPATGFSLRTSYLLRAVWITARSVLDATPSRSGRREMEGEALTLFARGEMSRNATAVYDRERFSELADICFWQLGSRRPLAH